jgi:class 3 adenylate cyclase/predicted ATPase
MQCPQCQHANRDGAKFCEECGTRFVHACPNCGHEMRPQAKFCDECGTPLTVSMSVPQASKPEAESRFHAILPGVMALLQRDRRVTYRRLTYIFGIDDALLEEIREELTFRRLAIDEDGTGLVWTGAAHPAIRPTALPTSPAVAPDTIAVTSPASIDDTDITRDESAAIAEPIRTSPEAERRQLTVMFCDLADSTTLAQQLDPEDLREVVRAYQATAAEVIEQYEGHMAQYLGDGLLIYFGWPVAHEDDAQRALHAGLEIVEAITTTLNPRLEQEQDVQLTVRLGVHTGPVVVGEMGGRGRIENLATGETVNIAARLEGVAAPNTVLISHVTARLVREAFVLEDLGLHELKGVAEPMPVLRVLRPTVRHHDEDESMPDGGAFLVGRDEEVGLLLRRWEQAKEGLGQVVLISGEAGIGKSSVVATLRHHLAEAGYMRLAFRCSPYHTNSVLYPVVIHLEQMLGFDRDQTSGSKLDKLEQALNTTSSPLEEAVPFVATLLAVPLEERYVSPSLSPQQQRQQTLDTLVGWLMEASETQPVLAVWEDLHWADPSTLEMLGLVLEQTPTVPMLHVLTFRPEFAPPWPNRSHMTPITLNRLERPQVEALITHLAGGKTLPTEVVQHIVAKTDGVPLYVEEYTKMLLQSELLREEGGQHILTGPMTTVTIPDTLQDSLMARLDQMQTAKEVAQLGAVLGREFAYDMIAAIASQDEATLQTGLAQLVEAELLYQRGRPPRARYIFKHALIQDAAYASLLRSTRRQVHQQIARCLEAQYPKTVETQPELIAYHYAAGEQPEAVGYWHRAGQRALRHSAHHEAVSYLTTGLAQLETLPVSTERERYELDLLMALRHAMTATAGYASPALEPILARAYELSQRLEGTEQQFLAVRHLAGWHTNRGNTQTALELSTQNLHLAQSENHRGHVLTAHWSCGLNSGLAGQFGTARHHLEAALALYTPPPSMMVRDLQDVKVTSLSWLALTLEMLGYAEQAEQRLREGLAWADELAHPFSQAFVQTWAVLFYLLRGAGDDAQEMAEGAIALATEHRYPYWEAFAITFLGGALAMQGQTATGIAHIRRGLTALQETGTGVLHPFTLALLAQANGQTGSPEAGVSLIVEAQTVIDAKGEHFYEADLYGLRGALLLQCDADHVAEAEVGFQQALAIARSQETRSPELRAATRLARLWQCQGKRQEAYDLLAPVYNWFPEGVDAADLKEAKTLLDELR